MKNLMIMRLIKSFDRAYLSVCEPLLCEFKISQVSFDILMFLHNNPNCCTAKEISEKRNIKPNVVSGYVEKLVNEGYLSRCSFEGDRRKIKLVCTEKCADIISKGEKVQRDFIKDISYGISENELKLFRKCIGSITENADNIVRKNKFGGHI